VANDSFVSLGGKLKFSFKNQVLRMGSETWRERCLTMRVTDCLAIWWKISSLFKI